MKITTLQFETTDNFDKNLEKLLSLVEKADGNIIIAPELCLSGYSYDRLEEASEFSKKAIEELKNTGKNIITTLTIKDDNKYFNRLHFISDNKIIYTQDKIKLFPLNDENKYFSAGSFDNVKIIDFNGLKVGFLICFELRFIEFWDKLKGADIIFIPAMWGLPRKKHLETLSNSLALMDQCFVVLSDSKNKDMASSSGIISPFGIDYRDDNLELIEKDIDLKEITKMRRYLPIGI